MHTLVIKSKDNVPYLPRHLLTLLEMYLSLVMLIVSHSRSVHTAGPAYSIYTRHHDSHGGVLAAFPECVTGDPVVPFFKHKVNYDLLESLMIFDDL